MLTSTTKGRPSPRHVGLATALILTLGIPHGSWAESDLVELTGDYRYTYHHQESAAEANKIAYAEAVRQAILTSALFREQTASLVDSALLKDLAQIIASSYLTDVQIVQQSERERTVYVKIRATVHAKELQQVIDAAVRQKQGREETAGLDQNRALIILSAHETADGSVAVVYQARTRLDWLSTEYPGSLRESANVMIDFYDRQGLPLRSDRHPARKTPSGDDVMNPGEIGVHKFPKPENAASFRVWLVK
jgi:hypothetical protein